MLNRRSSYWISLGYCYGLAFSTRGGPLPTRKHKDCKSLSLAGPYKFVGVLPTQSNRVITP